MQQTAQGLAVVRLEGSRRCGGFRSEFATIASLALGSDGSETNSSRQAPPLVGAFVNMAGELNSSSRVKRRASVKPPFHAVDFVFK